MNCRPKEMADISTRKNRRKEKPKKKKNHSWAGVCLAKTHELVLLDTVPPENRQSDRKVLVDDPVDELLVGVFTLAVVGDGEAEGLRLLVLRHLFAVAGMINDNAWGDDVWAW